MSAVISSTPRLVLTFGLSALVLGGSVVGCTGGSGRIAAASDRNDRIVARTAERHADGAVRALAKRDPATAIERAEAAVALAPRNADYRLVLGQAYQQAGRFASARDTFAEVLELTPGNGKAALSLALAQIATGDWSAAQATLTRNAAIIPVGDLGLATALAGNPAGAIATLNAAAREPGADAKLRQNLALSYALAGQWAMARVAAAADMSPADVDARLEQWAAFAQPRAASDQVASLLGVTAGADGGRPVALALNAPVPVVPTQEAPVRTAAVETPAPASPFTRVVFAPPQEVAQPLPTMLRAAVAPVRQAVALKVPAAVAGDWYVQIGAYSNVAVAKSGWTEATRRFATLTGQRPTGTMVAAAQGSLYRVSVGGFSRAEADRLCGRYRAEGGACFVRREAGDRIAQWLRAPVQVAAR
ncbi:tetratricopeptide repeat protein [Sphingomonas sp. 2SG]|uniref:SPOR domain-containing protein n=1 Tax=Sphingomonas sp. 2SG TaxID=2502201 RepID=UPI0010F52898|nr:tetratricopeptide repeat protein [Sphingomonas sp. 2SG]